jgi:hypothetical protein
MLSLLRGWAHDAYSFFSFHHMLEVDQQSIQNFSFTQGQRPSGEGRGREGPQRTLLRRGTQARTFRTGTPLMRA